MPHIKLTGSNLKIKDITLATLDKVPKATTLRFYYRLVYYCILVR